MSINDDILYKIDSEIGKDKEVIKLKKEIERLKNIINEIEKERCNLYNANGLLENAIDTLRKRNEKIYEGFMTTTEELCESTKEIERLNNIINKGIEAINVYQNEKTLSVGYEDLKRIRGILRGNEFDLKMFEEYLQELKGSESNE